MIFEQILTSLNFEKENIDIIKKFYENKIDDYLYNHLMENYDYFIQLGFTNKDIVNIMTSCPIVCSKKESELDIIRNYLLDQLYTIDEINKIILRYPNIFKQSVEDLNNARLFLLKSGKSEKEIHNLFVSFPKTFGIPLHSLKYLINYIDDIDDFNEFIDDLFSSYENIDETKIIKTK